MIAGRVPCTNPACRRTAPKARFPEADTVICRPCFRLLPASLQRRHKTFFARDRKLSKLANRIQIDGRVEQWNRLVDIVQRSSDRINADVDAFFRPVEKPAGIDAFLEEIGL
ncbi:hypothetical protein NKJ09_23375 [Mesorhizobium sp. M0189]|uniref:hypothetical protein n=1 Tax=Mesorhizobium sp. M0189 TaxID=2956909 RepID=UPI003336814C